MTQEKQEELKRQKDIGQFFTPQEVVSFIYDMLSVHLNKEEKWKKGKFPSIIDPACGEGVFLKGALDKEITKPIYVFGVDLDEKVKEKWIEINLLKSFGSKAELDVHFYHQNGLLLLPEKTLRYKRGGLNEYDLVVGNPPYGGVGLQDITPQLHDTLLKYEIWRRASKQNSNKQNDNAFLFEEMPENLSKDQEERLKRFPIEILFVERFIQLCKPGGHIAIIIPDGILSNSNLHYVREFISEKMKVNAFVSLPRETFKGVGTAAKTSIIFMTKPSEDEKTVDNYKIFLASIEKLEDLNKVYEYYKEVNQMNPPNRNLVKIINDSQDSEIAMVRVDKTLKRITVEEKPFSRWDVNYWHPKWADIIDELLNSKISIKYLYELSPNEEWLISTDHVRASKKEHEGPKYPIEYYSPAGFYFTGYDIYNIPHCTENAYERMKRGQVNQYDLLLGGFGMGPTGKSIVLLHQPAKRAIVGNIFILRTQPFYNSLVLDVFFKTKYGQAQFNKYKTGVAFNSLSNDEIKYLYVPLLKEKVIHNIELLYRKMYIYHEKAMETKARGDEQGYKKNIEIAEKKLQELIISTEEVIRGEKEDVI